MKLMSESVCSTLLLARKEVASRWQAQDRVLNISGQRLSSNATALEEPVTILPTNIHSGWQLLKIETNLRSQEVRHLKVAVSERGFQDATFA